MPPLPPHPPPANLTLQALEETSTLLHEAMHLTKSMGGSRSPVPLHETSLTLAALDLSLTFRVHKLIPGVEEMSNDPNKVTYHCLQQAVQALKQAGGPTNHPHGGYGGADSILLYLSHALATLIKCLKGLQQVTRVKEVFQTRLYFATLVGLAWFCKKKRQGRRLVLWVVGMGYLARKLHFLSLQRSVDASHRRLLTLLRLWVIMDSVMVYTESCKDRNVAHHTLIARPFRDDVKAKRWLSRQLLEAVPPPPETAYWYESSPAAAALRRFMNVVYASFGNGVAFSGVSNAVSPPQSPWRWRLLGVPVTAASFLYYAFRPGIASRDACASMSPAPIELLQQAWTSAHNPLTEWLALRLARRRGLAWQRRVRVAGVSCYLLSQSDPGLGPGAARPLLFFVHGGGFVAHLFLADMPALVAWTLALGPRAVLLIPEYTLVPHARFPRPTQELLAVYKAVREGGREGLGFVPAWVALAGESAGGNLAGSLCVALAGAVVEREEGGQGGRKGDRRGGAVGGERPKGARALGLCETHPHLVSVEPLPSLGGGSDLDGPTGSKLERREEEVGQAQASHAASLLLNLPPARGGGEGMSHTSSEAGSLQSCSSCSSSDTEEEKGGEGGQAPSWVRMPEALVLFYPGEDGVGGLERGWVMRGCHSALRRTIPPPFPNLPFPSLPVAPTAGLLSFPLSPPQS